VLPIHTVSTAVREAGTLPHRVHGMRQNPQPQPVCCDQYRYCLSSTAFNDTVYTVQFGKSVPVTGPVVAQRVGRDMALPFHDHGTRSGEWSASRPGRSLPRERAGTHCTGGWVGPGPVWTGAENPIPTGIRSRDRPARSQSLYRLSYPAHCDILTKDINTLFGKNIRSFGY
jgi:hypothetical protein